MAIQKETEVINTECPETGELISFALFYVCKEDFRVIESFDCTGKYHDHCPVSEQAGPRSVRFNWDLCPVKRNLIMKGKK
ncbi:hypothetical protein [Thermodesulfatator atlanticus]